MKSNDVVHKILGKTKNKCWVEDDYWPSGNPTEKKGGSGGHSHWSEKGHDKCKTCGKHPDGSE